LILFILSFGVAGFIFVSMRRVALRPWGIKIDESYKPEVSILVPTYNEVAGIRFKLENLTKLEYPDELTQIIIVDSNSSDNTIDVVRDFVSQHPKVNIQVLVKRERRGKSAALNFALENCKGDVVIVSDADCFWPHDILNKALPYLAGSTVGAISGPKILLNSTQSRVTKNEDVYLKSINSVKLGESKLSSTLLFEGGFSAYKREVLESFDLYNTGSDDCGTIIGVIEKGLRALFVPEAAFFTLFPATWKGKMSIKIRRAGQLVRVFTTYLSLLIRKRVKSAKRVVIQDVFLHLFAPVVFILLLVTTISLLLNFPYLAVLFLVFLVPKVGFNLLEVCQNYLILFIGICLFALNKKFVSWVQPEDRALLTENMLRQYMLI
jgi:cellulose synthase/poly-beta-1,6-N-acetylglucosamine synthase-like glycosyltransferase